MQIEDIIKKQREQLDVEQPPAELWTGIRNGWKEDTKKTNYGNWWKVAAAIFLLTTFSLLMYTISLQNKVNQLATLGDISEEYQEMENEYLSEIKVLEASIQIDEKNQDDFAWITEEMKTLEEINELYRKDIGVAPNQAQLVGALIDYYEKKIKLLKTLELEINRTQKFKKDEKINTDNISI